MTAKVTVAVVPRERFSIAAATLQRLIDATNIPFELIVVDCNMPERYRRQLEAALRGRREAQIIRTDGYLLPNQSRNLVIQACKTEFLCITETDVWMEDGCVHALLTACEEHPADVATPLIFEEGGVHGDPRLGYVRKLAQEAGVALEILPRDTPKEHDLSAGRHQVELVEDHCLLFRHSVLKRIGPLDEELNARHEIDLSLRLYRANAVCVLEPKARISFLSPPPVEPDERPYYYFRWDKKRAVTSHDRIRERWQLKEVPPGMRFVKRRLDLARYADLREAMPRLRAEGRA